MGTRFFVRFQKHFKITCNIATGKNPSTYSNSNTENEERDTTTTLYEDVFSLSGPVDRPNIKLIVQKRLPLTGGKTAAEGSYQDVLNPYIEELCSQIWNVPKTIVYSKLKWCGVGYDMVSQAARLEDNTDEILSAVSQFHAPCTDEVILNINKAFLL
ncbi:unnamed protein product [Mytilus edulis]|uniref:Uncharacterized protein n=1 Tax=Mytilus edulis TaxID=6550 RepID=A0A8S3UNQ9_MYTED|nr:unnamed protein product [Mytilus edulis]